MTAATALALSVTSSAHAETSSPLGPRERARVRPIEIALVPALGAGMLVTGLATPGSERASWMGQNGFDDGARSLLRAEGQSARDTARMTSDGLWMGLAAYPLVVDALVLAGAGHGRWDVALRLTVTYGEAALTAGLLTVLSQGVVGRGRPLLEECARDASYDPMCGTRQLSRSFFAGHPAAAFDAAGVVCQSTLDFELYGSRAGGIAACIATMSLAGATGVLRVVADKHWASDVLVGSGVGLATGLVAPWLVRLANRGPFEGKTVGFAPLVTPTVRGVSAGLVF